MTPAAVPRESCVCRVPSTSHQAAGLPPPPSSISVHSSPRTASTGVADRFSTVTCTASVGARRSPPTVTLLGHADRGARDRGLARRDEPVELERLDLVGTVHGVAELDGVARLPRPCVGPGREEADESRASLVGVVVELRGEPGLLEDRPFVDGRRPARVVSRLGDQRRVLLADGLVVRLRPAPQDRAQGVADRPDVPATDPGALGEVDRHDLAGAGQPDVVDARRGRGRSRSAAWRVPVAASARSSAAIRCS